MDAERYARIRGVFGKALALPAAERDAFLAAECAGDDALRAEVARLLAGHDVDTEALQPPETRRPLAPERLGRYRIEGELGEGGMGVVYSARPLDEDRRVAIKVLHPWLQLSRNSVERFRREAVAGIAVRNEHVVPTLETGSTVLEDGTTRHYLVMEHVEGRTLRELQAQLGQVPESLLREIALQATRGLMAIHAEGILHRDLKPENIVLSSRQQVLIMDLGVAKLLEGGLDLTAEGQFIGSLAYAAPEQFGGGELGPAADLYSLGVVLYELSSGQNPFRADDAALTIHMHLDREPAPLRLIEPRTSRFFSELVQTLLRKKPADRFASAAELALVLEEGESSPWWQQRALRQPGVTIPVARDGPLCGRADQLARLHGAWEAAAQERGGVVALVGEEGMGKTRLLAEWLDGVDAVAAHVVYSAFAPGRRTAGLVDALRDHLGSGDAESFVARHLSAPASRAAVMARLAPEQAGDTPGGDLAPALAAVLRGMAAERPVLWIADDIQFAGEEARGCLAAMARATRGQRAMLLLAGAPDAAGELGKRIGADVRIETVELHGLDAAAVATLLETSIGGRALAERLAPGVTEWSDGVPLVVHEVIRALRDQGILARDAEGNATLLRPFDDLALPPVLHDLVSQRVTRLDPAARRLLDAAAVAGTIFDADLVAAVLHRPVLQVLQELAELERVHALVRSEGRRYRFEHHLVAEALRKDLPPALRAELHALTAEAIEGRQGAALAGDAVVSAALHHLAGSRPGKALPLLDAALAALAERSEALAAFAGRALSVEGLLEGATRLEVLLRRASALDVLARRDEQLECCREAVALARRSADDATVARALIALSGAEFGRNRPDRALELLAEVLELARRLGDRSIEMRACINRGTSLGRLGRRAEARAALCRGRDLAHEAGDARIEAAARLNEGLQAKEDGETDVAEREFLASIELAKQAGDRRVRAYAHANLGLLWTNLGRYDDALVHIAEQLRLALETGDPRAEEIALSNRALVGMSQGQYGAAHEEYKRVLELARLAGDHQGIIIAHLNLGEIERAFGRMRRAAAYFRRAAERLEPGDTDLRARLLALQSDLALQEGRIDDARELARDSVRAAREAHNRFTLWHAVVGVAMAELAAGERDVARASFEEALAIGRDFAQPAMILSPSVHLSILNRDPAAAAATLAELGPRATAMQRLELSFAVWQAGGDRALLDAARAGLAALRREALADVTPADLERVPLYRAIDAAL